MEFVPYHQVFQELLTPNSLLATTSVGVDVILLRLEDFVRDIVGLKESRAVIQRTARELCEALGPTCTPQQRNYNKYLTEYYRIILRAPGRLDYVLVLVFCFWHSELPVACIISDSSFRRCEREVAVG